MSEVINSSDERRKQIIEIWKVIVEVQRHFNDIGMRIRGMFVTILVALFASIGFLLDKKLSLDLGSLRIQFATLIPIFGIIGTCLIYFIDRYWYHRLLTGAVKHAIVIETKYRAEIPELSLSDAIGAESPYEPRGFVCWIARRLVRHPRFRETGKLHSDGKLELFYKSVIAVLVGTSVLLAVFGGVRIGEPVPMSTPAVAPSAATGTPPSPAPTAPVSSPAAPVPGSSQPVTLPSASPGTLPSPAADSNPPLVPTVPEAGKPTPMVPAVPPPQPPSK